MIGLMTEPVLILTMKWGTLYGANDVNRLYRQVRRHLVRPHRFICFTDDSAGIDPGVEALPLPELGLPKGHGDTRWRKLALFHRDLGGFAGMAALFLDLDLVVVNDILPFFDLQGAFHTIRDDDLFRPKPLRRINAERDRFLHSVGNSSIFRYVVGDHADILDAIWPIRSPRWRDIRSASSSRAPSWPRTVTCTTGRAAGASASRTTACCAICVAICPIRLYLPGHGSCCSPARRRWMMSFPAEAINGIVASAISRGYVALGRGPPANDSQSIPVLETVTPHRLGGGRDFGARPCFRQTWTGCTVGRQSDCLSGAL
ncbi:hypothetical protein PAYE108092_07805 [Paracoccus yeei]